MSFITRVRIAQTIILVAVYVALLLIAERLGKLTADPALLLAVAIPFGLLIAMFVILVWSL